MRHFTLFVPRDVTFLNFQRHILRRIMAFAVGVRSIVGGRHDAQSPLPPGVSATPRRTEYGRPGVRSRPGDAVLVPPEGMHCDEGYRTKYATLRRWLHQRQNL